ncbi:MAG: antitoxin family protein [Pirellulales bacterium]|nr:antitoxin family protein [Pirellulales bacterium]
MQTFDGIYENGVVRFPHPVAIAEHAKVKVIAEAQAPEQPPHSPEALRQVYAILSERYDSGCSDTAARHNEHQP